RDFGHIVMFFLVGSFAGVGFGRFRGLAALHGFIRSGGARRHWFFLAFVFLGHGLLRALGRCVLVLLRHRKRNRQSGEKKNGQNSHACLREKRVGAAL